MRYKKLAVAMAVVGDKAPPEGWPHPYVKRDAIPVGDDDPATRFGFFVDSHRGGKWLLDPRELSVRELCFVVDTIVELRELQYAQQVDISTPRKLENLYFAVKYDNGRIQQQRYQWPHGSYRLIDVGKKGGICADQAYFVSHAGKAKGVPTVVFMGQGLSGTHAWVGFLQRPGLWEFEAARCPWREVPGRCRLRSADMETRDRRPASGRNQRHGQWQGARSIAPDASVGDVERGCTVLPRSGRDGASDDAALGRSLGDGGGLARCEREEAAYSR